MSKLLLNHTTEAKLAVVRSSLPHALLLSGEKGVGLATIARSLTAGDLESFIEPLDSKEQIDHVAGTVSVDRIRLLYEQTRATSRARRISIIDDADRMSLGAQAAFLKLLEEPNDGTHFILTSHSPELLLPTVRSRLQTIAVLPISAEQTKTLIDAATPKDATTRVQLEYLAAGLPAELHRLLSDPEYFKQRAEIMGDTKILLTGSVIEKLGVITAYHQNRAKTLHLLDSALAVTKKSLAVKPQPRLVEQLAKLLAARENIGRNYNARLQLTLLVL